MSGSFESVQWNACEHRLDFGLYSHPKEFLGKGMESEPKFTPREKSPEEYQTHNSASSRTTSPIHNQ